MLRFEDTLTGVPASATTVTPPGDRSWKQARLNCMVLGSDLVSINNAVENHKIEMIKKVGLCKRLVETS